MINQKYEPLLEPFEFQNGLSLKNRVVMAPMTNYSSNEDGTVSDAEVAYYIRRSKGVSMVITACTYVTAKWTRFPRGIRWSYGRNDSKSSTFGYCH